MSKRYETKRIVIATIGSLGDLHPCLALSLELTRRGHHVTIASTPHYRSKVEALGISFQPMRPDWDPTDPQLIRQCDDLKKGPEVLYRKMLLPELHGTYNDLLSVALHADLLITGELVYAAPLVAEKLKLPWVSAILSRYPTRMRTFALIQTGLRSFLFKKPNAGLSRSLPFVCARGCQLIENGRIVSRKGILCTLGSSGAGLRLR